MEVDVLVIGAGPAGSVAALSLARRGCSVLLADRHEFPRDKICGDALIPDALGVLQQLGLEDEVLLHARALRGLTIFAPNQRSVAIEARCAVIPRQVFDDILRSAAVAAGAVFAAPWKVTGAVVDGSFIRGAVFEDSSSGGQATVRAGVTVLATGAAVDPLRLFGVCARTRPNATAARVYFEVDAATAADADWLTISYDRAILPGYGWVFPGPDRLFNVGVGYFQDAARLPNPANLRVLMERFLETFPAARRVARSGRRVTSLRGASLRTGLGGATLARPGLLVAGEAAGLTYSFSGEGIGKSMASGLLAADTIASALDGGSPDVELIARRYRSRLRDAFLDRFHAYKVAQNWLTHPRVANLIAWRARRSRRVYRTLQGLVTETADPRALFSWKGFVRALVS